MYLQIKRPFKLAYVVSNQSIEQCKTDWQGHSTVLWPKTTLKKRSGHYFPLHLPPGPLLDGYQQWHQAAPATNHSSVLFSRFLERLWISALPLFPLCPPRPIMPLWHQWLINPISLHLPLYISLFCISGIYWSRVVQYWQHIKLKPCVHEQICIGKNL